jgi:hypothetical protein
VHRRGGGFAPPPPRPMIHWSGAARLRTFSSSSPVRHWERRGCVARVRRWSGPCVCSASPCGACAPRWTRPRLRFLQRPRARPPAGGLSAADPGRAAPMTLRPPLPEYTRGHVFARARRSALLAHPCSRASLGAQHEVGRGVRGGADRQRCAETKRGPQARFLSRDCGHREPRAVSAVPALRRASEAAPV